ncbi:MAG TPA: WXG100 family type VII secretion target [Actinoplanes sp.]|nr:WXG100 family type VII secretion target [Actinoplanes sp.]
MTTPINITPQMLMQANGDVLHTADSIDGQLAQIRSYVAELAGQWLGTTSARYQDLMENFDAYGVIMNDSLHGIADGLVGNFHNYTISESTNLAGIEILYDHLPGANNPTAGPAGGPVANLD